MNNLQLAVLKILTEEAIATIAKLHNTTRAMVEAAIQAGNQIVCEEFQRLLATGWDAAREVVGS